MIAIGFANMFYTLWNLDIMPQYSTDAYGKHWHTGNRYQYSFIKNISTSIERVKELYPDVEIDEGLRGITSSRWCRTDKIDMPANYLAFGKYAGRTVEDIASCDLQYLIWAIDNMALKQAQVEAIKATNEYRKFELQKQKEINERLGSITPLKDGRNILILPNNPVEGKATVHLSDTHTIELRFARTKELFYNGFSYEIPIMNGAAKKVKGKEVEYDLQIIETEINKEYGYCRQVANVIN